MEKFTRHSGVAAHLPQDNIDTDAIIPSREMKAVSKHGLGEGLFAGRRYLTPGSRNIDPEFVLNQPAYANTSILLAGNNFGCGSSREHAVWALKEYGIRVIIAGSFGSIFFNNCVCNGLLPVVLDTKSIDQIVTRIAAAPQQQKVSIDLENRSVSCAELAFDFTLDAASREMLLQGLDPIGMTLLHEDAISAFEDKDRLLRPWAYKLA
jgi:3-isopropylmalate/(R)-2-methylmalate dehydratase small subunit